MFHWLPRHHAKQNVVFAVAARTAARNFEPLAALLSQVQIRDW